MTIRSLLPGAALSALAVSGFALPSSALTAGAAAADHESMTTFNIYLPLTNTQSLKKLVRDQVEPGSPSYHRWLTPAQFKQQFGPSPAAMRAARAALERAGFTVVAEHTQNLTVQGPVWAVESMFATQLEPASTAKGSVKWAAVNHGKLNMPQELASLGAVVPEFAPHLVAHVHSHVLPQATATATAVLAAGGNTPQDRLANTTSLFYANDLNEAYTLPSFQKIPGTGATIGIVMSSTINPADIASSFNSKLTAGGVSDVQSYSAVSKLPVPTVTVHTVNGGSGPFNAASGAAAEASLDTQMSLGTAPGAREILYDMPDLTDASILAAYQQVVEENLVDVVSSSFGQCELDYTAAANNGTSFINILQEYDSLFMQGNAQGITFVASSGDQGAVPCVPPAFASNPTANGTNYVRGVETPAADPNVTAVGGTNLQTVATPTANDVTYASENANFDPRLPAQFSTGTLTFEIGNNTWGSGGGFSQIFAKPAYQTLVNTGSNRFRAVPDVALMMGGCPSDADLAVQNCKALPRGGAIVWIGGKPNVLIGTSSAAPEMAGVLARAVSFYRSRQGNVNPIIYTMAARQTAQGGVNAPAGLQYFHRNISGNNNGYTVSPGQEYSEVLGVGTLNVVNFLGAQGVAPAGAPDTASNP